MLGRNLLLAATLALVSAGGALPAFAGGNPTVETAAGRVQGLSESGVTAFLGVPYAAPPVGGLRWRAPRPVTSWSGTREATRFAPACYQAPPHLFGPITAEFNITPPVSEDCLYLNVWAPERRGGALPVFVWIHGGGFGSGGNAIPIYDGRDLASKGVVVVSINYRLGVFGFLAHPELTRESELQSSGNYGLLDMIAALEWVKANISRFGGDPSNVTIGGQSAGAAAVNDLQASPLARGLFARAIAQSGSGMGIHMRSLQEAEEIGSELTQKLAGGSLETLRTLPAETLANATVAPPPTTSDRGVQILFAPNLDRRVVTSEADQPAGGLESHVPLLTGFNTDESFIEGHQKITPAEFEAWVRKRYAGYADRFLSLYPHADAEQATRSKAMLGRDRYMASLIMWCEARSKSTGPIYAYLFDHPYPIPESARYGAFHTAEVPYVFNALDRKLRPFTNADSAVAQQMQAYWIAFFESGEPNPHGLPAWPKVTPSSTQVMGLGDHLGMRPAVSTPERLQAFRDYVASGGALSLF